MKFTVENLIHAIANLPRDRGFNYISPRTSSRVMVQSVGSPFGPITIKRWDPKKSHSASDAETTSISKNMLFRICNAIQPGVPINFDRVLGASYSTRSSLEALLAHTPEFYFCYPGRIEVNISSTEIKRGHKHLIWLPDKPHANLTLEEFKTEMVISEMPGVEAVYEAVAFPDAVTRPDIDIEVSRMHARIQAALVSIARGFGGRAYVAKNDQGIQIGDKRFGEMDGVITDLTKEAMFAPLPDAVKKAALIDCIWLRNGKYMPAVLEVEHSTGVTSGLTRMLGFKKAFLDIHTRYIIAAPDEDADKVLTECSRPQFEELNAAFLPYSCVHELYSLQQRKRLKGIEEKFLDNYLIRKAA